MTDGQTLPDPLAFAARALAFEGALVEPGEGRTLALLPPRLARDLGVGEELWLSTGGGQPETTAIGFGAPLFEALVERTRREVPLSAMVLDVPAPARSRAVALGRSWAPRNGVAVAGEAAEGTATYLRVAYAWTAEADERHEGAIEAVVHLGDGGRPGEGFAELCRPSGASLVPWSDAEPPPAGAAAWIARVARAQVPPVAANLLRDAARRQAREHARVAAYYESLAAEARKPRRRVDPAAIEAKLRHLQTERDARLADLRQRYAMRLRAAPAAALLVRAAVRTVPVRARRRKAERDLLLRLPAGASVFDSLPCEGCSGWADWPALCDDRLHVLCETCVPSSEGRPRCPACG